MIDETKGRFAQLLSTKVPDVTLRDVAKAMLKVNGIKFGTTGNAPRLRRSRR